MKKTVYLDTTIPSFLFDERERSSFFADITKKWWEEESSNFDVCLSRETITELSQGEIPHLLKALDFALKLEVLPDTNEIIEIAEIYIKNKLMPQILKGDSIHLAFASFYKVDFLLTWNCNHLANANKRQQIRIINSRLNLPTPDIITPLELFREN
ncbi:MAG: hypothetical protein HW421_2077 [Ignavibacteria bacterium]|nr:hypothetical protein [Ignavibacteria bacterium]